MEDWIAYVGGAILAGILALAISMLGFGLDLQAALGPAIIAAVVAVVVVYLTD